MMVVVQTQSLFRKYFPVRELRRAWEQDGQKCAYEMQNQLEEINRKITVDREVIMQKFFIGIFILLLLSNSNSAFSGQLAIDAPKKCMLGCTKISDDICREECVISCVVFIQDIGAYKSNEEYYTSCNKGYISCLESDS